MFFFFMRFDVANINVFVVQNYVTTRGKTKENEVRLHRSNLMKTKWDCRASYAIYDKKEKTKLQ